MTGKLIDAEKFAVGIILAEMQLVFDGDGKDTEYKRGAIAAMQSLKEALERVPADYDIDKVVQQLTARSTLSRSVGEKSYKIVLLDDALSIVKAGRK